MKLRELLIILVLLSSVGLLFLSFQGKTNSISSRLNKIFEPLIATTYRVDQNEQQSDVDTNLELLELEQLRLENQSLRDSLNFADRSRYQFIGADVSSIKTDGIKRQISISRGSDSGVKVGMAVVAEGYLVGRVSSVSPESSVVELVTDPEFRASGMIVDSESVGLLRGSSGSGVVLEKVAAFTEPSPGDSVVTSALGGVLPKGIPVGEIVATSSDPDSVFLTARISLPVDFNSLQTVLVIIDE